MAGRAGGARAETGLLAELFGRVQAEKARRAERQTAALEQVRIGLPRGEILPPVMGRGTIGGGFPKGALSRTYMPGQTIALSQLRRMARKSPLIQAIHSARVHQIYRVSRRVIDPKRDTGWRILHKHHFNPRIRVHEQREQEIAEKIEAMFLRPHPIYERTFGGFMSKFVHDHLTINRPAIEILRNANNQPVQLVMRNGAEVLPTYALAQRYYDPSTYDAEDMRAVFEQVSAVAGFDVAETEYVLVRDGRLITGFNQGQLFIPEFAPTTEIEDFGFAPSHVERAIEAIISFACGYDYNSSYFTRGFMADVIILLAGGYTDQAMQAIEDQMQQRAHGLEGAHQLPIVQVQDMNDAKVLSVKQGNREMEFSQWMQALISLVTAVYRMHPSEINFVALSGADTPIFEHDKTTEISSAKDQGLGALIGFIEESMTEIVTQIHPDFIFRFWNVDREDDSRAIEITTKELASFRTLDEVRVERGEKPFGQWWSQVPSNPVLLQYANPQAQQMGGSNGPGGDEQQPEPEGDGPDAIPDFDENKDEPPGRPEEPGQQTQGQRRPPPGGPQVAAARQQGALQNEAEKPKKPAVLAKSATAAAEDLILYFERADEP